MKTWLPNTCPSTVSQSSAAVSADVVSCSLLSSRSKFIYSLKRNSDCSPLSGLTVVLFDDVSEKVMGDGPVAIGTDEFACRIAIEGLFQLQQVKEIIVANNTKFCPQIISQSIRDRIAAKRVCILMDVFAGEVEWGPDMAEAISTWDLPVSNLRQFSKRGSKVLEETYGYELIGKPYDFQVKGPYTKMENEIRAWMDACYEPFQHPTKSRVGIDELSILGKALKDKFHDKNSECHSCESLRNCNCLEVCLNYLSDIRSSERALFDATIESVTKGRVAFGVTDSLLKLDCSYSGRLASFAISKTLSDFGADPSKASVPGAWLSIALGVFDTLSDLDRFEYRIENHLLQPIFGFVHSLKFLSMNAAIETEIQHSLLRVTVRIQGTLGRDIEDLKRRCDSIFKRRDLASVKGDTTRTFLALHDGGVKLIESVLEIKEGGTFLRIDFAFNLSEVR
jgi:hypothetical protein